MEILNFCTTIEKHKIESIALGGFDGVHFAHQKLFSHLDKNGAIVAIESYHFDLTPKCMRSKFISNPIIYIELDEIVNFSAEEFIDLLKKEFVNLKKIVVGYDFRFGKNRLGSVDDLDRLFDGEVVVVEEVKIDGVGVHSRHIRELIRCGDVTKATQFLNHYHTIEGSVISGQGIGMRRLYPTLNLETRGFLIPKEGVYASFCEIDGEVFDSVTFVGHRVSTDGSFSIETHILDTLEITANAVNISFVALIRDNAKFDDLEKLKKQIAQDILEAKNRLSKEKNERNY